MESSVKKYSGPDDRKTPAYTKQDGVRDYVPMREWKNSLINLLNIAGTGPILGLSRVSYSDLSPLLQYLSEISSAALCMIISLV